MTIRNPFRIPRGGPRRRLALIAVGVLSLAFSPAAFAYLDPSTGSMVVSAIVGIFASIALAVKTYWYKIKGFFRRDRKAESGTRERPE
jgi:O-antigen/teichoic acid export membrane protein